ncbi:1-acyl-sn-glycerol-3-phosphate acyltransferase beta-like [Achroia grisella]|uniref:1-acyl-sn-glycerol-3-phosphate acyltransferase beta-like n=1 Tax=Achroia grisella TaxID=688607 RepID=UPI0027D20296|nr:1-acyl-sn-glycerol-3-phosphate acyltransferase beta-like [Achroia grisella]
MLDNALVLIIVCVFTFLCWKIIQKEPNAIQFNYKFALYYIHCSLVGFFIWPVFLFNLKDTKNARIGAGLLKPVTKIIGIKWSFRNENVIREERGAVVVSNHQSSLDILGMFQLWHIAKNMTAIAKKEIFYVWPFGLAAYLAGVVFIDRSKTKYAYDALKVTSDVMVNKKTKIWLFPEGTRNKDYSGMLPFKKGAFNMAVAAQVPIIPAVFSPYYFINKKKHIFNKGHVIIQFLDPEPTTGLTMEDVPDLIEKIHTKMMAVYKDLEKEIINDLPADYPYTLKG